MNKRAKYLRSISFLLTFLLGGMLHAQVMEYTLFDAIEHAQTESPAAKIARSGYENTYYSNKSLMAGFKPGLYWTGNLPGFSRQIILAPQDDGTNLFVFQNQWNSQTGLEISQTVPWTNTRISLSSRLNRLQDFVLGTTRTSWSASFVTLSINQPIGQFNSTKWDLKLAPLRYDIAVARYQEALEDIATDLAGKFFDIYIAKISLENAQLNEGVNDTIYTILKGRYSVGKIAENDLLQGELAWLRAKTQATISKIDYDQAVQDFKITMGLPLDTDIRIKTPDFVPDVEIDAGFALSQARQFRSDYLDYDRRRQEAERDIMQAKYGSRFQADLTASVGLSQRADTFFTRLFEGPAQDQEYVSINFRVPIFDWKQARHRISASAALQKQTHQQIRLDQQNLEQQVRVATMRFRQLQQQIVLDAKADTIAQRRFEVAKKRYLIGKIDITNLQIAQNEKDNSRRAYIQTLKSFWVSYYRLRRLTLYDFEKNAPVNVVRLYEK